MFALTKCINTISRCTTQYRSERLSDTEVNGCQCVYIMSVCQHPGISQDALAQSIYINKSNVTRQLSVLEERGFIARRTSDIDRRVVEVYPSAKATEILPRVRQAVQDWNGYLTEDLTADEQAVFFATLERVTEKAKRYFDARKKD